MCSCNFPEQSNVGATNPHLPFAIVVGLWVQKVVVGALFVAVEAAAPLRAAVAVRQVGVAVPVLEAAQPSVEELLEMGAQGHLHLHHPSVVR